MKIYAIPGLGADHRVFDFLQLNETIEVLHWIEHHPKESIESYAKRLLEKIDTSQPFVLLAVSFGGVVALELSKYCSPEKIILISSVSGNQDIPFLYRIIGDLGILNYLPSRVFNPPHFLAHWLFGAKNRMLLNSILDDTDPKFAHWSIVQLLSWKGIKTESKIIKIHGSKDRLLPIKASPNLICIKDGGHFMIVDEAEQISQEINNLVP